MDNIWIVGDPDECAQRIRQLYDETGGFGHMLCITQDPGRPPVGDGLPAPDRGGGGAARQRFDWGSGLIDACYYAIKARAGFDPALTFRRGQGTGGG